jgi:hypothetical protein
VPHGNQARFVLFREFVQHPRIWIEPEVSLAWNSGFAAHELNDIQRLVCENLALINSTYESASKNS